jgi:signal transduction histidine kinase
MKPSHKPSLSFSRGLTLRLILTVILPLTLLSMVIAVGSVFLHQQEMRAHAAQGDWQAVTDPALELTLVAPLALIPPLLFSLAALWFANRQIIQPLQKLEAQAAALAWGDFDAVHASVGGISEVQRLQKELAEMARKVQAAQEGLRDYIGAITAAQEEERARLARELHDDTIQAVIALKQRVQLAQQGVRDASTQRTLAELETLSEQTIENLRRMTRALRPIYLEDLGLAAALDVLARETAQNSGIAMEFQKIGREQRLPPEVELALYRIAQEALNNVVRHSQARRAEVRLTFDAGHITLEVSDNGVGFVVPQSPTDFAPNGHFGLLGMYERASLIGARLEVESAPGNGTRLKVRM